MMLDGALDLESNVALSQSEATLEPLWREERGFIEKTEQGENHGYDACCSGPTPEGSL